MTTRFRPQMRKQVILLLILLPLLLSACGLLTVYGSGKVVTETRDVHNFNRVSFGGTGELLLTQSEEESLTVTVDDNLIDYIEFEVRGKTLYLGLRETVSPSQPVRFTLKVRDIVGLEVAGAASAITGDIVTEHLTVNVSGLSSLRIGALRAQKLVLHLSGSNEVELTGAGEVVEQEIVMSGTSNYRAPGLRSQRVDLNGSGISNAAVWATDFLDVTVSGSGNVDYYGSPRITQNGSGNVSISSLGNP